MSAADAAAALLWLSLTAYAVLGGADFGGGVWDIFASGPRKQAQRRAVATAMGPVWEANHVWLIFMITGLFTAFPTAFTRLALGLYLPFSLIALGIVLRGAAFAFRAHGAPEHGAPSGWGIAFGGASTVTPFLLGACAGAVAAGAVPVGPEHTAASLLSGWTTPFALLCGAMALSVCSGLAAAYLAVEASDGGDAVLAGDFRRRALLAGFATLVLALAALPLTRASAPGLWSGLTHQGLPLMVVAMVLAVAAAVAMYRRRYHAARVAAASQVAAILLAWALAQYPYLVPPDLTVEGTAGPPETMALLLVTIIIGGALLVPSLLLLFRVFKGQNPAASRHP